MASLLIILILGGVYLGVPKVIKFYFTTRTKKTRFFC